ncbi:hypothetical protein GJAV_G00075700 [Gymnothorax javanicus]|nr:hypothetical protein GJAV_G00075700 [Gymnothorax javanicus]
MRAQGGYWVRRERAREWANKGERNWPFKLHIFSESGSACKICSDFAELTICRLPGAVSEGEIEKVFSHWLGL